MRNFKEVVVVLVVLTVATGIAMVYDHFSYTALGVGRFYAIELDQEPETSIALTDVVVDPHPDIIKALENPDEQIVVRVGAKKLIGQLIALGLKGGDVLPSPKANVEYEGKYYRICYFGYWLRAAYDLLPFSARALFISSFVVVIDILTLGFLGSIYMLRKVGNKSLAFNWTRVFISTFLIVFVSFHLSFPVLTMIYGIHTGPIPTSNFSEILLHYCIVSIEASIPSGIVATVSASVYERIGRTRRVETTIEQKQKGGVLER